MPVSVTRTQTRTVQAPAAGSTEPLYTVQDHCTSAIGIPRKIYVLLTADDSYSRVALPGDMALYPDTKAQAQTSSKAYYRTDSVTVSFTGLVDAKAFAAEVPVLVQYLANNYEPLLNEFLAGSPTTTTVTSE